MPEDAIDILRKSSRQAIYHSYGFEMKPYHFRLIGYAQEDFLQHLEVMGFTHYVILDRKNRLRKIISSIIAHQKGSYHNYGETRARLKSVYVNLDKVEIDFDSKPLLDYLRDYDNQFSILESSLKNKRLLKLTYEDDIQDDPEKAYSRICEFLDIERKPVSVNLSKTNPFPLRDMIDNLGELENVLSGTPYEWMLND
jgi:LPS sulfotransferase NodH